jgi:hypothetical protein
MGCFHFVQTNFLPNAAKRLICFFPRTSAIPREAVEPPVPVPLDRNLPFFLSSSVVKVASDIVATGAKIGLLIVHPAYHSSIWMLLDALG